MTKKPYVSQAWVWLYVLILAAWALPLHAQDSAQVVKTDMETLFRMADRESRIIRLTEQALQAAQSGTKYAKSHYFPSLSIDLSGSYIGTAVVMGRDFSTSGETMVVVPGHEPTSISNGAQPTPHWGNSLVVEASQVIYSGGAVTAQTKAAKLHEQLAKLDVEKQRQEVRMMLAGYYLDLAKLNNQQQVIAQHILLTQTMLKTMHARHDAGVVLSNDITRYELQLSELELMQIQLNDAVSIIQHALQTMLHTDKILIPDSASIEMLYSQLNQALSEATWHDQAAQKNLDIHAATARQQLAEQELKATQAASIPSVMAIVCEQLAGPYTSDFIPVNANINSWFIGIGIHYNLDALWKNRHAVAQAAARKAASAEQSAFVEEQVSTAIHTAYVRFLTAFTEVQTQQKQVVLANQNYNLVMKRYEADLALLTDMLDASNKKLTADMALVNARISLIFTYYQLKYSIHSL